jgi:hypothetical protein
VRNLVRFGRKYLNLITGFLLLYFILFVGSTSVTQDDYSTLSDLSLNGFWGPTIGVWDVLGGNISSVVPRTIALGIGFTPALPLGLVAYSAVTLLLVTLSLNYLLGLFVPMFRNFPFQKRLPLIFILSLGFEGLFTPGELGVFGFSAAAGVHIWPICFIILGHKLFFRKSAPAFVGTTFAFLYASNSNIPEGSLAVLVLVVLSYQSLNSIGRLRLGRRLIKNLVLLGASMFGLVIIFLAPGFQARTKTVGVSLGLNELLTGVIRAGIYFSIDILTHPFIYLVLILGYAIGVNSKLQTVKKPIQDFGCFALAYFLLLVLGAGVAYPAWHQTLGLYLFLLPLAFSLGVSYSQKNSKLLVIWSALLIPVLVVSSLTTLRSGYTVFNRKLSWQSNFEHNVCQVESNHPQDWRGSEITYPPKELGVEDINTWPWMEDGFKKWVVKSEFLCHRLRIDENNF